MDEPDLPTAGMTISIRSRHDVVIVDPERFLAAARQAYLESNPDAVTAEIEDIYDAVWALVDRHGRLGPPQPPPSVGRGAPLPGRRVLDRPDGMSPAGELVQMVLTDPMPLQDYGCFLPEDPFALPPDPPTDPAPTSS